MLTNDNNNDNYHNNNKQTTTTTTIIIIRDFYNLLTAPQTVSNTYAQVAQGVIVCNSRATHRVLTAYISRYVLRICFRIKLVLLVYAWMTPVRLGVGGKEGGGWGGLMWRI